MRPGEIVAGRYEVESRTGTGGMGVVYRARDRETSATVALKLVRQQEIESVDRFSEEVELLARLAHPHIVGYITHGVSEAGLPYLVMPWLEGLDLQHRLESNKLGVTDALKVARSVADALAYLHERGLVHRDLKPSNIFLEGGSFEAVKLLDFGIARAMMPTRQITVSGVLIGTPGYMAPEQARGDRELTPAVDVFALGCVLFECLAGRPLFSGKHMMAVLAKVLFEEPLRLREVRSDVPLALDVLVKGMVAKDPAERPRDGAKLRSMVDELLGDPRTFSAPPSSIARLTRAEQRMVTVLVALLTAPVRATVAATPAGKSRNIEKLDEAASKFAVRLECLADGTAIALAEPGYAAADQAALLARFARYISASVPESVIAIATGRALTDGRLPVGEAIDRGVKIANASGPHGGVHLDDATASLITSRFQIQRDGQSLQLHDEIESLDPARPLLGAPTRCVGRDRELSILQATALECSEEGGARAVLITGAAGIGKSRLRHEFVRRLQSQSVVPAIWQCRGDLLHASTPYALTAQIAREAMGIRPGDAPELARRRLQEVTARLFLPDDAERVAEFLGELISAPFDDENRLQLRAARKSASAMGDQIRRAFEDFIRKSSAEQPVVLAMDDLHWADSGSIKLIDNLLRKLRKEPLLIIAMARDEIHDRFPALWRERDLVVIRLPPLATRACAKLARESLGEKALESDVERIVERCEGNAFFLEELIRATSEGAHRLLPQTVLAVAEARLERMSPSCRRLLRAASVFGEIFWHEALAVLVDDGPAERETLLSTLVESEAIVPRDAPRFSGTREFAFRHALLRSAVYATLTEDDRRLGHRLAAEWLRNVEEAPETVAIHWLEGAEHERAAASFEHAGWAHWASAKADAAARCAARALLFTDPMKDPVEVVTARIRLLALALDVTRGLDEKEIMDGLEEHLRQSHTAAEGQGFAHGALERVVSALRESSSESSAEGLALAGCVFGAMADLTSAWTLLAEASTRARLEPALLQKIEMMEIKVACWAGEFGRADDLFSRATLAGSTLDAEALLSLAKATVAVGGQAKLSRALENVSRAEAIGRSANDNPVFQTLCHKTRFLCFFFGGDLASAAASAREAIEIARRSGLRFEECLNLHNLAELYIRLDDRALARDALERSLNLSVELGAPEWLESGSKTLLAYLDGTDGDHDADRRLQSYADDFGRSKLTWLELHTRYWLGLLLSSWGDPRAQSELKRALDIARTAGVRVYEQDCLAAIERAPAPLT
jgi:tetratricopeptide (TPR) repeat protein